MANQQQPDSVASDETLAASFGTNRPHNTAFADVITHRQQRRAFLVGSLGLAVSAFLGVPGCVRRASSTAGQAQTRTLLGFEPVAVSQADTVVVPEGYRAQVLVPWGTPLRPDGPPYRPDGGNSGQEQEMQVGSHHDGMHFFPLGEQRGLLVINHEYVDPDILHSAGPSAGAQRPHDEIRKEMAAHGVSVLEVTRTAAGDWQLVQQSTYNRRITASTPMTLRGPVRGSAKLTTRYSPDGTATRGTLNNCSGGVTPWNTYMAAEENWSEYFVNRDPHPPREHSRYGVANSASRYRWDEADIEDDICQRFEASSRAARATEDYRNEPNTFGWMVEIDPFSPNSVPQKRTALGRFAHEGVVFAPAREGQPVACYCGDDSRFEYIYKFVSAEPYHAASAGGHLLDKGTLYVARFNDDGSGDWLALTLDDPDFQAKAKVAGVEFEDQADVLINTRLAADIAGATPMDRPEWGAVHPHTGEVCFTLTNNSERTPEDVNAVNPRPHNTTGHIVRWRERGGHGAARQFDWDLFLLGGDSGTPIPVTGDAELTDDSYFACPDGLWFDPRGVLWIQTDMSGSLLGKGRFGNNQMLAADPVTRELKRFLVGPVDSEVSGISMAPDMKTLFVNIQHPGSESRPGDFTSHWPDGGNARPRSATLAITRDDGGVIGT